MFGKKKDQPIKIKEIDSPAPYMSPGVFTVRTIIESIPFGIGPYGIGDVLSLYEGIQGKMVLGRKLDLVDRIISIIAALIPIVPATPFREFAQRVRYNSRKQSQSSTTAV